MRLWQKIIGTTMIIAGVFLVGGEAWAKPDSGVPEVIKRYESFNYETGAHFDSDIVNKLIDNITDLSTLKKVRKDEHQRVLNEANKHLDKYINKKIDKEVDANFWSAGYADEKEFGLRLDSAVKKWANDHNNTHPDSTQTEAIKATIIKEKKKELKEKYTKDKVIRADALNDFIIDDTDNTDIRSNLFDRYILQIENPDLDLSLSNFPNLKGCLSDENCYGYIEMQSLGYILGKAKKEYPNLDKDDAYMNTISDLTGDSDIKKIKYEKTAEKVPFDKSAPDLIGPSNGSNGNNGNNGDNGNNGGEQTEAEKQQEQCRKNAGFLGFLICPFILQTSNNVMEWAYRTIYEDLSRIETSVLEMKDSNPVFTAWAKIRDLANIVFIIVFLIVVLSQITGIGIDNYGIKKILPKLIASAILINLSFIISQLFVDTSNLLGVSLSKIFSITKEFSSGSQTYSPAMKISGWANALSIGAIVAGIFALLLNPGIIISLALLLIPMIGALLLAVALLMVRQAVAIMLVVTSPIAIALMLLPNTKSFVDRYKKLASAMWLFYPICAIVVGGSNFAARVFLQMVKSGGTEHDFLYSIMAIAVMTLPFFATPGILRKTMDGVGGIGSKLNNFRNASVSRASNAAKNSRLVKRAQSSLNTHSISKRHRASAYRDRMKLNQERREDDLYSNKDFMNEQEELANMEHAEKLNPFAREEKMEAARFKHEEATDPRLVVERMQANRIRHEEAMDSTMRRDRMKTAEMNHQVSMADAGSRVGMAGYYNTMTDAKINSAQSRTEKQMRDATMDAISAGNLEISGGSWIDSAGVKQTAPARITNPNDANQMRQALQAAVSSNNHIAAGAIMEYMNKNGMTDDVHRAYKDMSNGGAMGMNIEDSAYRNVRSAMANGVLAAGIKEDDPGMAKWAKNTLAGKATTVDDSTIEAFADMSADAISKMDDKAMARTQAVLQSRKAAFVEPGPIGGKLGQAINNMDDFKKAMAGTSDNDLRLQNKTKASLKNQTMKW